LTETDLCRFTLTALTSSVILAIRSEFTKKQDDYEGEVVVFDVAGACQRMQRKREDAVGDLRRVRAHEEEAGRYRGDVQCTPGLLFAHTPLPVP